MAPTSKILLLNSLSHTTPANRITTQREVCIYERLTNKANQASQRHLWAEDNAIHIHILPYHRHLTWDSCWWVDGRLHLHSDTVERKCGLFFFGLHKKKKNPHSEFCPALSQGRRHFVGFRVELWHRCRWSKQWTTRNMSTWSGCLCRPCVRSLCLRVWQWERGGETGSLQTGLSPPRIQQRKARPTSLTKASVADLTKPLLFGAADRGPQGENLKDFNNTSNPSLHDGLFLSLPGSNGGSVGASVGMPVLKRK